MGRVRKFLKDARVMNEVATAFYFGDNVVSYFDT